LKRLPRPKPVLVAGIWLLSLPAVGVIYITLTGPEGRSAYSILYATLIGLLYVGAALRITYNYATRPAPAPPEHPSDESAA
jgi:hypothetical protein